MTEDPADHGLDLAAELGPVVALLRSAGCVRAEDEAAQLLIAAHSPAHLETLVARRVSGEPLEHVLGFADFAGVRVRVAPGVFVPRHRSEHLVEVAAELLPVRAAGSSAGAGLAGLVVLDLCAATGALGLAVHRRAGPFRLVATDVDPVAVVCAAENLAPVGGVALLGDLFAPVPTLLRGRISLIVANAPYVPTAELALLPHEAREHEPRLALDGGHDGLDVHRRLLPEALGWLAPGAAIVIEVADVQVPTALALVVAGGLTAQARPAPDDPGTVAVIGHRLA